MVTGDQPATAKAIAKQVGIIKSKTADEIAAERNCDIKDVRGWGSRVTERDRPCRCLWKMSMLSSFMAIS